nr:MAG TPA: hypothetical protein [Caudoviricetes sp.]
MTSIHIRPTAPLHFVFSFIHIRKFIAVRTAFFRHAFIGRRRGLGRLSEG